MQEYTCRPLVQSCTKGWHVHVCLAKSHGHSILCPCGPAIQPTSPTKRPVQKEQALRRLGTGVPCDLDAPLCRIWVYIPTCNTAGWSRPSLGCSTCPRMAISAIRGWAKRPGQNCVWPWSVAGLSITQLLAKLSIYRER